MIWIIGLILDKLAFFSGRVRARYYLHLLGSHGKNVHIENGCSLNAKNIFIGDNVFIGDGAKFLSSSAKIYIGNNVMFGPNVSIVTGDHNINTLGTLMINAHEKMDGDDQDVIIEDDVWVGMGVIILKGVRVGKGSVIGVGTLLTKDILPYSVVTNERITRIRKRFDDDSIKLHEKMLKEQNNRM